MRAKPRSFCASSALVNQKSQRAMRVRVASQPTFTRYVFEMSDVIPVTTDRTKDTLVVTFGIPLKFDLADAKASMPPVLKSIDGFVDTDASTVRFSFNDVADIRSFREDTNYVVDIAASDAKDSSEAPKPGNGFNKGAVPLAGPGRAGNRSGQGRARAKPPAPPRGKVRWRASAASANAANECARETGRSRA